MTVFIIQGTPNQQRIVRETIARTDYPWENLVDGLRRQVNRSYIPVEWADLSRYARAAARSVDAHDDHEHDHPEEDALTHAHGEEDGDTWHAIAYRERVLGLAWYSGKVSLDLSLERNEELAAEVFLSEGAHMVDFFYMTDDHRRRVSNAFHGDPNVDAPDHGHDWFDKGSYWDFVGEAFMGGFVMAYSNVPVTIKFRHPTTPKIARQIRQILTPAIDEPTPEEPTPTPEEPTQPEEPAPTPEEPTQPEGSRQVYGLANSGIFHDSHYGIPQETTWPDPQAAMDEGRRPCKTCDPWKNPAVWGDLPLPREATE